MGGDAPDRAGRAAKKRIKAGPYGSAVRSALHYRAGHHPELLSRQDALLCSINDRLGGLPGQYIGPLSDEWMLDIEGTMMHEADLRDEADRKRRR